MDIYLSIAKTINDEIDKAYDELSTYTMHFKREEVLGRIHAIVERNLTADAPDPQEAKMTCIYLHRDDCDYWVSDLEGIEVVMLIYLKSLRMCDYVEDTPGRVELQCGRYDSMGFCASFYAPSYFR